MSLLSRLVALYHEGSFTWYPRRSVQFFSIFFLSLGRSKSHFTASRRLFFLHRLRQVRSPHESIGGKTSSLPVLVLFSILVFLLVSSCWSPPPAFHTAAAAVPFLEELLVDEEFRAFQDDEITYRREIKLSDVLAAPDPQSLPKRLLPHATTFGEDVRTREEPFLQLASEERNRLEDHDFSNGGTKPFSPEEGHLAATKGPPAASVLITTLADDPKKVKSTSTRTSTTRPTAPIGGPEHDDPANEHSPSAAVCPALSQQEKRALCREYAFLLFGGLAKKKGKTSMAFQKNEDGGGIVEGADAEGFVDAALARNAYELHVFRANQGRDRFDVFIHNWALAAREKLRRLYKPVASVFEQNANRKIEITRRIWPYGQRKCYKGDYFCILAQVSMSLSVREVVNLMLVYEARMQPLRRNCGCKSDRYEYVMVTRADMLKYQMNLIFPNTYPTSLVSSVSHTGDHHWVLPGSGYAARLRSAFDYRWQVLHGRDFDEDKFFSFWHRGKLLRNIEQLRAYSENSEKMVEEWRVEDDADFRRMFDKMDAEELARKKRVWNALIVPDRKTAQGFQLLGESDRWVQSHQEDAAHSTIVTQESLKLFESTQYFHNLKSRFRPILLPGVDKKNLIWHIRYWLASSSWFAEYIRFNVTYGHWPAQDLVCDQNSLGLHHVYATVPPMHWRDTAYLGMAYRHWREVNVHKVDGYEDTDVYSPLKHHEDQLFAAGIRSGNYGVVLRGRGEGMEEMECYAEFEEDQTHPGKLQVKTLPTTTPTEGSEQRAPLASSAQVGGGTAGGAVRGTRKTNPSMKLFDQRLWPRLTSLQKLHLLETCRRVRGGAATNFYRSEDVEDLPERTNGESFASETFWFEDASAESAEALFARIARMEKAPGSDFGAQELSETFQKWRILLEKVIRRLNNPNAFRHEQREQAEDLSKNTAAPSRSAEGAVEQEPARPADNPSAMKASRASSTSPAPPESEVQVLQPAAPELLYLHPEQQFFRIQLDLDAAIEASDEHKQDFARIRFLLRPYRGVVDPSPESITNRRDRNAFLPYYQKFTRVPAWETPSGLRVLRQTFGPRVHHTLVAYTKDQLASIGQAAEEPGVSSTLQTQISSSVSTSASPTAEVTTSSGEQAHKEKKKRKKINFGAPTTRNVTPRWRPFMRSQNRTWMQEILNMTSGFNPDYWTVAKVLETFPTVRVLPRINMKDNRFPDIKDDWELRHHVRYLLQELAAFAFRTTHALIILPSMR
ncbi:unnamed protein product [Amoebophrya sp. A120]|nr:unnamed protein product [Amoebophrya sp. A120]|eukprot:GSA120T00006205001.1